MTSVNPYKLFAATSLDSTEHATELSSKVGRLIVAEAWLDLAEQTTQIANHEADEAHSIIEQPLKRASIQDH